MYLSTTTNITHWGSEIFDIGVWGRIWEGLSDGVGCTCTWHVEGCSETNGTFSCWYGTTVVQTKLHVYMYVSINKLSICLHYMLHVVSIYGTVLYMNVLYMYHMVNRTCTMSCVYESYVYYMYMNDECMYPVVNPDLHIICMYVMYLLLYYM